MTKEHLIPACLGGKLSAKFLCKDCNSRLGHRAESRVRDDPMIRREIERLAARRPDLADDLRKRLRYIGHSEQGEVPGYMRSGEFIVRETTSGRWIANRAGGQGARCCENHVHPRWSRTVAS